MPFAFLLLLIYFFIYHDAFAIIYHRRRLIIDYADATDYAIFACFRHAYYAIAAT